MRHGRHERGAGWAQRVGRPTRGPATLTDHPVKSPPAGGSVTVSTGPSEIGVRIEVVDEGIGIPLSARGALFEKCDGADPQQRDGPGGPGLGLYISRELVRRMGGTIGVRSLP